MAELNYDYDTQNGQYSDGDIEERMLEMARQGITYEELPKSRLNFPWFIILRVSGKIF